MQSTDGCIGDHVVIAGIHRGHLTLEITDEMFEALSEIYLDREKVIAVLLKLLLGSILVIENLLHLFKTSEWVLWERVEAVVGGVLETGCDSREDHESEPPSCFDISEVLEGIDFPRVTLEVRHYELLEKQ